MDSDRVLQQFRAALEADRAAGRVRRLAVYCRMFPGHDEAVAREYAGAVGYVGTESPPVQAPTAPAGPATDLLTALHAPEARRYADGREIARGGMGAVHRVHDSKLRRDLAMKVMLDAPSDVDRRRDRFVAEARVTAQLDHPGVVPIHDLGVDDAGRVFFTMKLVGGRTLTAVFADVRRGVPPWTPARAVEILIRVCETLAFAHSRGVIHRDVKPDNVMVGDFGEVYVMDWGLAKTTAATAAPPTDAATTAPASVSDDARAAGQTSVVGTPAYMPPEQAAGVPADARADVYAVGAMLYQLLTGVAPFGDSNPSPSPVVVLQSLAAGPPTPVATLAPDAEEELASIAERAMARDPVGRYPDAVAMAEDLRRFVEGRVVRAHRTGAVVELTKWVKRNRALAAAVGVAILLLAVGLITNRMLLVETRREAEIARRQAFRAGMKGAQASLAAGDVAAAGARLAEIDPAARSWEWRVLDARLDEATRILDACDVHFDAEGRIWAIDKNGAIVRGRPDEGTLEVVVPAVRGALFEVAPDASWAVIEPDPGSGDGLRVVALPSGGEVSAVGAHGMGGRSIDAARQWITWSDTRTHSVRVLDVETHREVASRPSVNGVVRTRSGPRPGLPWRDGVVALDADSRDIELLDARSLATVARLRGHDDYAIAVALSPDEPLVVSAAVDKTVRGWRLAPDAPLLWTHQTTLMIRDVALAPDGRRVFVLLDDGSLSILHAADGAVLRVLHDRRGGRRAYTPREAIAFSHDGRWAASPRGDETAVWDASDDRDSRVLAGHASFVYAVAFSPDGTRLASVAWDGWAGKSGGLRLWDAATGELIAALGAEGESFTTVAWSPDASRLYAASAHRREFREKQVRAFDAATGAEIKEFARPANAVATERGRGRTAVVAIAADESTALVVVDPNTGVADTWSSPGDYVADPVAWVGPDRVAAMGEANDVVVRGAPGRSVRLDLKGHTGRVWGLATSPDATRILTASEDGTVREWDLATGVQLATMKGQGPGALCAAYSPDGARIVTGGRDGLVHVWDAATHEEIVSFAGHRGYVKDVAFSPDGATLASASEDATVRIWSPEPMPVRQRARRERARLVEALRPRVVAFFDAPGDAVADAVTSKAATALAALRADASLAPAEREVALQLVLTEAVARRASASKR